MATFFTYFPYQSVVKDEIESLIFSDKANDIHKKVYEWIEKNGFTALVSLIDEQNFQGFIAVGKRGIPYDNIDTSFLESISRSSNVALGRSNYFKEYELLIKDLEKKVAERTQQLNDLAEEQKNIIDVMGHEIRTPLSVINNEAALHQKVTLPNKEKWLKREMTDDDINLVFDSFNAIDLSANQAIALVNDMLETARLDKGKFELNYGEFDIVNIAKTSVELMQKTIDPSITKINFTVSTKGNKSDRLIIEADQTRITQAIQALISNAIKYGVNLETGKSLIDIDLSWTATEVIFSIRDNGRGIKKEDLELLGQKFLRLNPETANMPRPNGTGLGLFVVKNIMKFHRGELLIESDGIGKGSLFTIKFPTKHI